MLSLYNGHRKKKKVFIENLNFLSPQKQTAEPNTFQPIIYLN